MNKEKKLEIIVTIVWIACVLGLFYVFFSFFLEPLNQAGKQRAEEQIRLADQIDKNLKLETRR